MPPREVKYAVVTMAFVVDPDVRELSAPCHITVWPDSKVEVEVRGRKGAGASRIGYRWRRVRDPANAKDLAGEGLAIVLDAAGPNSTPGDYELFAAWHRARVHKCEHGHYPADCSKCVLLYDSEESSNGD